MVIFLKNKNGYYFFAFLLSVLIFVSNPWFPLRQSLSTWRLWSHDRWQNSQATIKCDTHDDHHYPPISPSTNRWDDMYTLRFPQCVIQRCLYCHVPSTDLRSCLLVCRHDKAHKDGDPASHWLQSWVYSKLKILAGKKGRKTRIHWQTYTLELQSHLP